MGILLLRRSIHSPYTYIAHHIICSAYLSPITIIMVCPGKPEQAVCFFPQRNHIIIIILFRSFVSIRNNPDEHNIKGSLALDVAGGEILVVCRNAFKNVLLAHPHRVSVSLIAVLLTFFGRIYSTHKINFLINPQRNSRNSSCSIYIRIK